MRGLDWYIARRYLASRKRGRLLSLITWIALAGVTVGVTALIVVIGVMTGMQKDLRAKILGSTPHILVLEQGSALRMSNWRPLLDSTRTLPGVVAASPFVITQVSVRRTEYSLSADLYGIDVDDPGSSVTDMEAEIRSGAYDLKPPASGLPAALVGSGLATRMQLFAGDTILVLSMENLRPDLFGGLSPTIRQFEVTGTFTTGMYEYDNKNIYTTIAAAQDLLGLADTVVSGIGVRTDAPDDATAIGESLQSKLGYPYYVESWITTNSALFSALKLEKIAICLLYTSDAADEL